MPFTTRYGQGAVGSLVRFGLLALVPVVVLGAVLAHVLNADVQQRYLETSRSSATLIAQVGIQPLLTAQLVAAGASPSDIAQIDAKLQGAAVADEVQRIKVWNRAGTIAYSDNHSLIGKTFPIDDDLGNALAGKSSASITDGRGGENAGDTLNGPLIQVYVPLIFRGSSSASGAFELYLPYAPVQAAIDRESSRAVRLPRGRPGAVLCVDVPGRLACRSMEETPAERSPGDRACKPRRARAAQRA